MNNTIRLTLIALISASTVASALAQSMVPSTMNYQGFLTDANGSPEAIAAPENRNLEFRIYNQASGGTPLWGETQTVTVYQGHFSVVLGNGTAIGGVPSGPAGFAAVFANATSADLYFGITPQGGSEFVPRQKLLANAYALRAKVAEQVLQTSGTSQFDWVAANNMTVSGHSKITSRNTLEFGVNDSSLLRPEGMSAGQIGYQTYSSGLDIVGAWTGSDRRITMWAEGGTQFMGPISFNGRFGQHVNMNDTLNGFGVQHAGVYLRGYNRISFFANGTHSDNVLDPGADGVLLGSINPEGFRLYAGVFTGNGSGLTNLSLDPGTLPDNYNYLGINGNGTLEFGRGVAGKEANAGQMGYQLFTSGALDIVGAGTSGGNRRIKLWSEGGLEVTGHVQVGSTTYGTSGMLRGETHGLLAGAFGGNHSMGTQGWTTYFRTSDGGSDERGAFVWYRGGVHSDEEREPGGGIALAQLDGDGFTITAGTNKNGNLFLNNTNTSGHHSNIHMADNWRIATSVGEGAVSFLWHGLRLAWINTSGTYVQLSDERHKQDIADLPFGLEALMQLRPVQYHFKTDPAGAALSFGFIAQEAQAVLPELVSSTDDGMLALNYSGLIPVTIASVQELAVHVEQLTEENSQLRGRVDALEAQMAAMAVQLSQILNQD